MLRGRGLQSPLLSRSFLLGSLFPECPPECQCDRRCGGMKTTEGRGLSGAVLLASFRGFLCVSCCVTLPSGGNDQWDYAYVFIFTKLSNCIRGGCLFCTFLRLCGAPSVLVEGGVRCRRAALIAVQFLSANFSRFSMGPLPCASYLG